MPINRSFYFIRHGQTDWNKEKHFQGRQDIPLNATGRTQAEEAKALVNDLPIDLIVVSNLSRAKETAEIINESLNIPIIEDSRIAERDLGFLDGTAITKEQIMLLDRNIDKEEQSAEHKNGGVESPSALIKRISSAFNEHLQHHKDKKILFVSHGGVFISLHRAMFNEVKISDNATPYLFKKDNKAWNVNKI